MTADRLPRLANDSRGDRVAHALRDAITSGQFSAGSRLVETDLARQLGTSRGPVREALRQLEQEGLVASQPYRWTEVVDVSQDEIEQVLVPIRLIVERFAFERALPILDDGDYRHLHDLVEEMNAAADGQDYERQADADIRFHEHVITRSDQPHCLQIWRAIQTRVRAYFRRDAPAYSAHHEVAAQHQHLLDVLRGGDPAAVVTAVEEHIETHAKFGNDG
jgi:DNA-binding GntR family transcriptional regulator